MLGQNTANPGPQYSMVNSVSSPIQLPGTNWNRVYGDEFMMLATKTDGTLWAWGYGASGNLGQNDLTWRSSPVQVGTNTTWGSSLSVGYLSTMAIKTDGTLWGWGTNYRGQLGLNDHSPTGKYSSPTQIPGTSWDYISAGNDNNLALQLDE